MRWHLLILACLAVGCPAPENEAGQLTPGSGGAGGGDAAGGGTGPASWAIGGTVNGLVGTGLVLSMSSEDLPIARNPAGSTVTFAFRARLPTGTSYVVSVKTQPVGPVQVCTVKNGSGTAGDADVTNVDITCLQLCGDYVVLEPGSGECGLDGGGQDGSGLILDTRTGLTWMRNSYYPPNGLTWEEANTFCTDRGMRLPAYSHAEGIAGSQKDECAFPCGWDAWTAAFASGSWAYPSSVDSSGGATLYFNSAGIKRGVLCVGGELTTWTKHGSIYWSPVQSDIVWTRAYNRCADLGGVMPTIDELRTLVKGCPATQTGGTCPEGSLIRRNQDGGMLIAGCEGCEAATDGRYSELGDGDLVMWSYTSAIGRDNKLALRFGTGAIQAVPVYNLTYSVPGLMRGPVRCVRRSGP